MTNNLIEQVKKEVKEAQDNKEIEQEKQSIKAMLSIIEGKKDKIVRLQADIKKVEKMMEDKDYSSVNFRNNVVIFPNGRTWTTTTS